MGETSEPLCPLREDMSGEMPPCNPRCGLIVERDGTLACAWAAMAAKEGYSVFNRMKVDL